MAMILILLSQGEFFGETAMMMPVKRSASVRAMTQCTLFVLTLNGMGTLRSYYPAVARSIMQKITFITHYDEDQQLIAEDTVAEYTARDSPELFPE